ncbi:MAG: 3-deoxy-manno-octulosonate cytidylyltransferase [Chloroflexi bacterium]|nr:3-deoxy-manno-octulosonate cytidylyltransferase [Chloroflexota bacterium]
MKILGVIPARYGSTRLEGKPLKDICGKPMIQWVYERAKGSQLLDEVVVATDDQRIVDAVEAFGGQVSLTSIDHKTGTDRIAEVARKYNADIVVNIQGDEPLLDARMIDEAIQPLLDDPELKAATLCRPILSDDDFQLPHVVKVVFDRNGNALYFSRSPIPYPRKKEGHRAYEHIGIYVYRNDFLMEYVKLPQTPLELSESLEQLRILENGVRLKVVVTKYEYAGLSVDTAEDLERVRQIIAAKGLK